MLCAQVSRYDDGVRHLDAVGSPGQPWQLQPRSTKIQPKSTQDRPKIDRKSTPNRPRSVRNRAWMGPGGHLGSKVAPGADLTPKTRFAGPPGAPKLGAKIDPKSSKNRSQIQQISRSFFWLILEPSWGRFSQIWGSKMEPKLVQNQSQERSWSKCEDV